MQLWEKGLFSLDDKLSDYMPEFSEMTVLKNDAVTSAFAIRGSTFVMVTITAFT